MSEKPTAAFILSLIGGIFILIGGLVIAAVGAIVLFVPVAGAAITAIGIFGLVCGLLTILGAIWINSGEKNKVRNGAILVLIFSILSWFGAAGGFIIGFLLGLIGSILALTWNPPPTQRTEPPPPTQP